MSAYRVIVLFEGYSKPTCGGQTANCSCTLILGPKKIIVDTMTPWDGPKLLEAMKAHSVNPEDIDYVVSTHGHSDHTGNNNLFLKAKHIVGWAISFKDRYFDHPFHRGIPYRIDESVSVIPTPGHTLSDVSVLVKNVPEFGSIVVAGDLFENEDDWKDDRIWKDAGSESEELQLQNRTRVLEMANFIIPGHGKMFKVVMNVGLGIALWDIKSLGDSHILPGDGGHHTPVEFRFVVFRPFISEVLTGKVRSCNRNGVNVTLGFFDDIFIPKASLQTPSRFDESEQVWVWEYQGEDGTHDLFMDVGEVIRLRITEEKFEETSPAGPDSGSDRETDLKTPYSLIGTISEPGLGLKSWWKQEQAGQEEEGEEEAEGQQ